MAKKKCQYCEKKFLPNGLRPHEARCPENPDKVHPKKKRKYTKRVNPGPVSPRRTPKSTRSAVRFGDRVVMLMLDMKSGTFKVLQE